MSYGLYELQMFLAMINIFFVNCSEISVYSKAFYTYMTAICQGAAGNFTNLIDMRADLVELIGKSKQKVTSIRNLIYKIHYLFGCYMR